MLTLTNINVTTPSFNLMTPIPLLGFSVPGVFDMGANVALNGAVSVAILVQATKDVLVNTGSSASCPWIIDWNGSFTQIPTIQFGTCTLPTASKRVLSLQEREVESSDEALATLASKDSTQTRQTASVSVGMTVAPSVGMALKVFGFTALSAGIGSPIHVDVNTHWDTNSTPQCPANNVATSLDGNAALQLTGSFFGFSKAIPVVQSPTLATPPVCIPHI